MPQTGTWTTWTGVLPWWYTVVPGKLLRHQELMFVTATDFFSFGILVRTLFQPWKRDELSTERLSLQERFQVWGLNFISRFFGFILRVTAMAFGLITLLVLFLFFAFLWLTWLIAPLMAGGLLVLGLLTMFGAFS